MSRRSSRRLGTEGASFREDRKRREDEKSAGGAGAGAPGSKRAKVVKKKVKKNSKALGSGLSIWD